ncbi:hypothetical protein VNO78_07559 [Psophocarpus tetragonolobus]|uniref:Uncharacterized protein n=1 Tax=Psophocarpus tetragonolobus TaxID=3891 RepID=A0AAN9SUU1_PSOTE
MPISSPRSHCSRAQIDSALRPKIWPDFPLHSPGNWASSVKPNAHRAPARLLSCSSRPSIIQAHRQCRDLRHASMYPLQRSAGLHADLTRTDPSSRVSTSKLHASLYHVPPMTQTDGAQTDLVPGLEDRASGLETRALSSDPSFLQRLDWRHVVPSRLQRPDLLDTVPMQSDDHTDLGRRTSQTDNVQSVPSADLEKRVPANLLSASTDSSNSSSP